MALERKPRAGRRLRAAKLKERGVVEDIDYQHPRGLDRKLMRTLASSEWVRQRHNLLLIGPTGIGKTWLGCALAQKACRDGFTILHKRANELFAISPWRMWMEASAVCWPNWPASISWFWMTSRWRL
jgi:DNA replication protein DnaC